MVDKPESRDLPLQATKPKEGYREIALYIFTLTRWWVLFQELLSQGSKCSTV